MEIWGRCGECSRWFYCDTHSPEWQCPVCAVEPVAIENRATRLVTIEERPLLTA
jgi:hypothetical protein